MDLNNDCNTVVQIYQQSLFFIIEFFV